MCQQGWLHLTCTAPSFLCLKEQNHVFHLPVLQQHPWDSEKKKKKSPKAKKANFVFISGHPSTIAAGGGGSLGLGARVLLIHMQRI